MAEELINYIYKKKKKKKKNTFSAAPTALAFHINHYSGTKSGFRPVRVLKRTVLRSPVVDDDVGARRQQSVRGDGVQGAVAAVADDVVARAQAVQGEGVREHGRDDDDDAPAAA